MTDREQLVNAVKKAWNALETMRLKYGEKVYKDDKWLSDSTMGKTNRLDIKIRRSLADNGQELLEAITALYDYDYELLKKGGKLSNEQLLQWKEDHDYTGLNKAAKNFNSGRIYDRITGLSSANLTKHYNDILSPPKQESKQEPKQEQEADDDNVDDEPVKATTKKLDLEPKQQQPQQPQKQDSTSSSSDDEETPADKQRWHDQDYKQYTNYMRQLVKLERLEQEYADEFENNDPMPLSKIKKDFRISPKYKPITEEEYERMSQVPYYKGKTLKEINAQRKHEYDNIINYIVDHPDIFTNVKTIKELKARLQLAHKDATIGAKSIDEVHARAAKIDGFGYMLPNFKITERGQRILDHNMRLEEIENLKQQLKINSKYLTNEEKAKIEKKLGRRPISTTTPTPTPTAEGHPDKQYIQQRPEHIDTRAIDKRAIEDVFDRDDYADVIAQAVHDEYFANPAVIKYYQPEAINEKQLSQRERDVIKWNNDLIDQFKGAYQSFIARGTETRDKKGWSMHDIEQFLNDWKQAHPYFANRLDEIFTAYRDYAKGEPIKASDYRVLERFHNELARVINPQLDEFRVDIDKVIDGRRGPKIEVIDERSGPYFTPGIRKPLIVPPPRKSGPEQRIPLPEQPKQPRPPVEPVVEEDDDDEFIDIDELIRQAEERRQATQQQQPTESIQQQPTQPTATKLSISMPTTVTANNDGLTINTPVQTLSFSPQQGVNKFDNAFTSTNSYMHQLVEQSHQKMWPRKDIKDVKQMRKLRIDFNKNVNLKGGMPMSAYF